MNYREFFEGKRVTVMGIDPEGRGVQDAAFAAHYGAQVVVTDLKGDDDLRASLEALKVHPNISYRLGGHDEADFVDSDLVIRAASAPLGSRYLLAAQKAGVRIETDETLFLALAPKVTLIGVTGTRGKSTTTQMIFEILVHAYPGHVYKAGNIRGVAALPLLESVKEGDLVVMELSSWQLQQFGHNKLSPSIAVFTTFMPDHMNYYHDDMQAYLFDKAQIFINQTPSDTFVVSDQVLPQLDQFKHVVQSHVSVARAGKIDLSVPGEHNQLNAACALEAARALGIDDEVSLAALKNFKGVEGRLQFVREVRGIKIYNDNNSTTPDATIAALNAVGGPQTLLIMGGADKGLDMSALLARLPEQKRVMWLAGTGTDKVIPTDAQVYDRIESALQDVMDYAEVGDTILFSPAFASFGMFKNEYDRNDQFIELVTKL